MNVQSFMARTARDAMTQVRQVLGEGAMVLSTQTRNGGVEVLAMPADGMDALQRLARPAAVAAAPVAAAPATPERAAAEAAASSQAAAPVASDVQRLAMSTLSFQDYVRERMLRRKLAAAHAAEGTAPPAVEALAQPAALAAPAAPTTPATPATKQPMPATQFASAAGQHTAWPVEPEAAHASALQPFAKPALAAPATIAATPHEHMLGELRAMKTLIEDRFDALAFIDRMKREPAHARLAQRLLGSGFSAALVRRLLQELPGDLKDEEDWARESLCKQLLTSEAEPPIEDQGGVLALIGSTGVGKTTSTAKIAAAFATRHGAAKLGLVTLDAYRVGAHEQLRAYGRILGVPVHTAHDRSTLEDLLSLLGGKRLVLVDTAGIGQRDSRTRELLEMLSHASIRRLLVVNASAQGDTIDDVMLAYRASQCAGCVISKLDEAVKLGPALDAAMRHRLKIVGVANGQRVPEDWHRLSARALVHRALRATSSPAYQLEAEELGYLIAGSSLHGGAETRAHTAYAA